jgi:addiction module RelE/StbE family toxin
MTGRKKIAWTGPALDDLREAREFIRRVEPSAARRLAAAIRKRVLSLGSHPRSGRVVPEFTSQSIREIIVAPYRIVYRLEKRRIVILRVWHGRRDLGSSSMGT